MAAVSVVAPVLTPSFALQEYLSLRLTNTLSLMVSLTPLVWVVVWFILIVLWALTNITTAKVAQNAGSFLLAGGAIALLLELKWVFSQLTPTSLRYASMAGMPGGLPPKPQAQTTSGGGGVASSVSLTAWDDNETPTRGAGSATAVSLSALQASFTSRGSGSKVHTSHQLLVGRSQDRSHHAQAGVSRGPHSNAGVELSGLGGSSSSIGHHMDSVLRVDTVEDLDDSTRFARNDAVSRVQTQSHSTSSGKYATSSPPPPGTVTTNARHGTATGAGGNVELNIGSPTVTAGSVAHARAQEQLLIEQAAGGSSRDILALSAIGRGTSQRMTQRLRTLLAGYAEGTEPPYLKRKLRRRTTWCTRKCFGRPATRHEQLFFLDLHGVSACVLMMQLIVVLTAGDMGTT